MLDYISEETVSLNKQFIDWRQAVEFAGKLLLDQGVINRRYVDDMFKVIEENGPYIVVSPGIAFAHARPKGNVYKNKIALVTLNPAIDFGHDKNDPVEILLAIAAKKDEDHLALFSKAAQFLMDENNKVKLLAAKTFKDIRNINGGKFND